MKYFKDMVKTAREYGVGSVSGGRDPAAAEAFFKLVESNEVFVYSGSGTLLEELPDYEYESIDAPFTVFSFELTDGPVITDFAFSPEDRIAFKATGIYCLMVCELTKMMSLLSLDAVLLSSPPPSPDLINQALVVFCLARAVHANDAETKATLTFTVSPNQNRNLYDLIRNFLERLAVDRDGVEEVSDVVMLPAGQRGTKRKPHPIRRVFHVVPKSMLRGYVPGAGRHVDWTHRWWVRGHWVYFKDSARVGKNRQGEYVERGRTWRSEHEKGPDGAELIKKTRIVKGPET